MSSVIFFDIGTTLIVGPAVTPAKQISAALNLDLTAQRWLNQQLMTSLVDSPKILASLLENKYNISVEEATKAARVMWKSQREEPTVVKGGRELLFTLQAKGIRYGFISNLCFPYAQTFTKLYGSLAITNGLRFFSFKLGLMKPDLAIFQKAITVANVNPYECIMVGDSYENDMEPAIALGMTTIWLVRRFKKEKTWLESVRCGILPMPTAVVPALEDLDLVTVLKLGQLSKLRHNLIS